LEQRHLDQNMADVLAPMCASPVLVVGAGQGVVQGRLQELGLEVWGLDYCAEMARAARRRRGLQVALGDAGRLPWATGRFESVIVSTGVLDFIDGRDEWRAIVGETQRVTRPRGRIFFSFSQLAPTVEQLYRDLGIIADGRYFMRRPFELMERARQRPIECLPMIRRWAGAGRWHALRQWLRLGFARPAELRDDERRLLELWRQAEAEGLDRQQLIDVVPEVVPYWHETELRQRFDEAGLPCRQLTRHVGCVVVHCRTALVRNKSVSQEAAAPAGQTDWIIRTQGVTKRYGRGGRPAVASLHLTVPRGIIFGLLGPNGAGKTTTLSMLCGWLAPDEGAIEFRYRNDGPRAQPIGYVPQELALFPRLTARENLKFFGALNGVPTGRLNRRIGELLELVGLASRERELVSSFSVGMQRRLNLVAGLVHEPELLLLDEPTVGIDPQSRNCLVEAIDHLRDLGTTILYTTHYMEEASRLCDRIAIIDEGRLLLEDHPRQAVDRDGVVRLNFVCPTAGAEAMALVPPGWVTEWSADGRRLQLCVTLDQDPMEVAGLFREAATAQGLPLTLASVTEPDLESLFLDITGKRLRDGVS
jgi:ABC-2 type transport system ATP-binding protein